MTVPDPSTDPVEGFLVSWYTGKPHVIIFPCQRFRTHYVCQECGRTNPKDMGRCPGCGAWNSMLEEIVTLPASKSKRAAWADLKFQPAEAFGDPRRCRDTLSPGDW